MKASELIKELESKIKSVGDHEVAYYARDEESTHRLTPIVTVWGMYKDETNEVEVFALCNQDQHDFNVENMDILSVGDDFEAEVAQ